MARCHDTSAMENISVQRNAFFSASLIKLCNAFCFQKCSQLPRISIRIDGTKALHHDSHVTFELTLCATRFEPIVLRAFQIVGGGSTTEENISPLGVQNFLRRRREQREKVGIPPFIHFNLLAQSAPYQQGCVVYQFRFRQTRRAHSGLKGGILLATVLP